MGSAAPRSGVVAWMAAPLLVTPLLESALCRGARADPLVWVVDDGEKIRRDAAPSPLARGEDNAVWRPGQPARVFAMRDEAIALQVVVSADRAPLDAVTVEVSPLVGPSGATIAETPLAATDAGRVVGRPIERFVEQFVDVRRASGGRTAGESLGWESGSGPDPHAFTGEVPDALIPVEVAPSWAPYPMHVAPRTSSIVWIDVNVPADQEPGTYRGAIQVYDGARALASIDVVLDVASQRMPDRPTGAMVYYDPEEIRRRMGDGDGERHLWKVLHAHRIAPLHDATTPADVARQHDALDGSLYTPEHGYLGPARGVGDGVLSIGAYGAMGDATDAAEARVRAVADATAGLDVTDVFLYAADEDCASPRGAAWKRRIDLSSDPNERRVRVAWTCSHDPGAQPVDVVMVDATYDPSEAHAARARGKAVWVYNGALPRTGTFLLDAPAVSPRVNGWLAAMHDVPRWFYWESTYWYDRHGKRAFDPFEDAESFHNDDGDWADGDGVLLYPGRQRDAFAEHSLGFDGVVASIRLKNWRRGVEDAAYVRMAAARDPARTRAILGALIPAAFTRARPGRRPAWNDRGADFFEARRRLLDVLLGVAPPGESNAPPVADSPPDEGTRRWHGMGFEAELVIIGGAVVVAAFWTRRRRRFAKTHAS